MKKKRSNQLDIEVTLSKKPKNTFKVKNLDIPPFEADVYFIKGGTMKQVQNFVKDKLPNYQENLDVEQLGGCCFYSHKIVVVWMNPKYRRKSYVIHEIVHMIIQILEVSVVPIGAENTELLAYLIGHYSEEALDFYFGNK